MLRTPSWTAAASLVLIQQPICSCCTLLESWLICQFVLSNFIHEWWNVFKPSQPSKMSWLGWLRTVTHMHFRRNQQGIHPLPTVIGECELFMSELQIFQTRSTIIGTFTFHTFFELETSGGRRHDPSLSRIHIHLNLWPQQFRSSFRSMMAKISTSTVGVFRMTLGRINFSTRVKSPFCSVRHLSLNLFPGFTTPARYLRGRVRVSYTVV